MQGGTEYILTIGGFDPCNGAGITQDVKTFEQLGVPALSAITCITIQNDAEVRSVDWLDNRDVHRQIDVLLDRYPVHWIKISLVRDIAALAAVVRHLRLRIPAAKILWDPVQVSSSGFRFNEPGDRNDLVDVLSKIDLVLPNFSEMASWGQGSAEVNAAALSKYASICLKGGHRPDRPGTDILFLKGGGVTEIRPGRVVSGTKHGSGCVFASALTASLYSGQELEAAIRSAKVYTAEFLDSNEGALGSHHASGAMKEIKTGSIVH